MQKPALIAIQTLKHLQSLVNLAEEFMHHGAFAVLPRVVGLKVSPEPINRINSTPVLIPERRNKIAPQA